MANKKEDSVKAKAMAEQPIEEAVVADQPVEEPCKEVAAEEPIEEAPLPLYIEKILKMYPQYKTLHINPKGGTYTQAHPGTKEYNNPYYKEATIWQ